MVHVFGSFLCRSRAHGRHSAQCTHSMRDTSVASHGRRARAAFAQPAPPRVRCKVGRRASPSLSQHEAMRRSTPVRPSFSTGLPIRRSPVAALVLGRRRSIATASGPGHPVAQNAPALPLSGGRILPLHRHRFPPAPVLARRNSSTCPPPCSRRYASIAPTCASTSALGWAVVDTGGWHASGSPRRIAVQRPMAQRHRRCVSP